MVVVYGRGTHQNTKQTGAYSSGTCIFYDLCMVHLGFGTWVTQRFPLGAPVFSQWKSAWLLLSRRQKRAELFWDLLKFHEAPRTGFNSTPLLCTSQLLLSIPHGSVRLFGFALAHHGSSSLGFSLLLLCANWVWLNFKELWLRRF